MTSVQVQRLHNLCGHRNSVYTIQRGNEPHFVFSAGGDGMIAKWDLQNPQEGDLVARLPNSIYALHFLQKENVLVAGQNFEGIHLLDWSEKKELASLKLGSAAIFDIQSFGNSLVVASGDGSVTIVDIDTLTVKFKRTHSEKSARTVAINPERGEAAVGYSDNFIRIFDLEHWQLKREWQAHAKSVFTLVYSPDSSFLLSGSRDARIKVWDVKADYHQAGEVVAHMYAINHLEFSPDGKHFVTCSLDKSIKVWRYDGLKLLKVIDKARHAGHGTSVNKLLWTSFDHQLVSASDDRTLSVWKLIF